MKTAVRNPDGTVLAEVEHRDSMRTWIQLFLVFGTFAASPSSVADATLYTSRARRSTTCMPAARGDHAPRTPASPAEPATAASSP